MINFTGEKLTTVEKELCKLFVTFVLSLFVSKKKQNKVQLTIRLLDPKKVSGKVRKELLEYHAWMTRSTFNKNRFTITIDVNMLNKSKKLFERVRSVLECIGHELVHVKQYMNGEARDYANGDVWYKGERYKNWEETIEYWFSPWELEAYAFEQGLVAIFKKKIIEGSSNR